MANFAWNGRIFDEFWLNFCKHEALVFFFIVFFAIFFAVVALFLFFSLFLSFFSFSCFFFKLYFSVFNFFAHFLSKHFYFISFLLVSYLPTLFHVFWLLHLSVSFHWFKHILLGFSVENGISKKQFDSQNKPTILRKKISFKSEKKSIKIPKIPHNFM